MSEIEIFLISAYLAAIASSSAATCLLTKIIHTLNRKNKYPRDLLDLLAAPPARARRARARSAARSFHR
jgi:hypothetical protein